MLQQLSLDEFLVLSKTGKRAAVYREISADRLTPIGIVENLHNEMRDGVILESGLCHQDTGRYSFIAFGTMAQLSVENNRISTRIGSAVAHPANIHPFTALRKLMSELSCVSKKQTVEFINGAVGFMTYDAVRLFESIPDCRAGETDLLPEMLFNFYETTLMFDHLQQKLLISIMTETGKNSVQNYHNTQEKLDLLITKITAPAPEDKLDKSITAAQKQSALKNTDIYTDISDEEFMGLIQQAKQHIKEGDIFQVVLSRCFMQQYTAAPFELYRALRRISPAPYMFYLPVKDHIIIGASPEKLISVHHGEVEINPIAGTRPQIVNNRLKNNDEEISTELLNDPKERAEHIMLVDLARNDLGSVCAPGSIKIKNLLQVKHFSHVSHITSTVTGQLREDKDALDALAAAFPAGTLSGAPKIRAMEIIDALETSRRGMYGGAICRLDYEGNLDSCIAIRMAILKDGIATVRAGAGIVQDSDPQSEANESRHKAQGILDAVTAAQGELK